MKYDRNNNPIYRDVFGRRIHNGDTLTSPCNTSKKIVVTKGWDSSNGKVDYFDLKTGNSLSAINLSNMVITRSKNIARRRNADGNK